MSSPSLATSAKISLGESLRLIIEPNHGTLKALGWRGEDIWRLPPLPAFFLEVGPNKRNPLFQLAAIRETDESGTKRVSLDYKADDLPGVILCQEISVGKWSDSLVRRFTLTTTPEFDESGEVSVHNFTVTLSGIGVDAWAGSTVSIPMARFLPDQPLAKVVQRERRIASENNSGEYEDLGVAPDCGLGAVLLSHPGAEAHFGIIPLAQESPVRGFVFGEEGRLAVEHRFGIELRLESARNYVLGRQVLIVVEGDKSLFLRGISRVYSDDFPVVSDRPAWAATACILEVDSLHYGGIAKLNARLPEFKALGYDTIYLMPWHIGPFSGYGTLDYWKIDPAKGTLDDLKALTARAHELGLKVLFDLLVNIAMDDSQYLKTNGDWFYRDLEGRPQRHTIWPGYALDPASPGYRQFLRDYCRRCVTELGADGFRVDAASYRGANWNPLPGLQPHQHAHAIYPLLEEIRQDLRKAKPEAVLMAECFGPVQVTCSDIVCYQWVGWLDWILERLTRGESSGRDLAGLLRDHFGCMPAGTWLVTYTHTHDTVTFQGREWDGPAVRTFFAAVTALSAANMTFGGGWAMRERPSAEERGFYQALAEHRKKWGPVASDEVHFAESPHPALLVAERSSAVGRLRVTANFGNLTLPWISRGEKIYSCNGSKPGEIEAWDVVVEKIL